MPVYLVHGFRWPREGFTGIRVHAVVNNLDDCSVEYIQNDNSRAEILNSFRKMYPETMRHLDESDGKPGNGGRRLEFIEQYNPDDLEGPHAVSQPYAFVGDKVIVIAAGPGMGLTGPGVPQGGGLVLPPQAATTGAKQQPVSSSRSPPQKFSGPRTQPMSKAAPFNSPADTTALSINVEEVLADGPGLTNKAWEALADLRDKIAEGEKIGWWVVYNGDPERAFDDTEGEEADYADGEGDGRKTLQGDASPPPVHAQPPATPRKDHVDQHNLPREQLHQQSSLTALPLRPLPPVESAPSSRPDTGMSSSSKGKGKEVPNLEPSKIRDTAKAQGLRKKFFGRRP